MNKLGSSPSSVSGQAGRVPASQKVTPEQGAALLQSQGGTLTAEVQVTRKETGAVEHHTLVFTPTDTKK